MSNNMNNNNMNNHNMTNRYGQKNGRNKHKNYYNGDFSGSNPYLNNSWNPMFYQPMMMQYVPYQQHYDNSYYNPNYHNQYYETKKNNRNKHKKQNQSVTKASIQNQLLKQVDNQSVSKANRQNQSVSKPSRQNQLLNQVDNQSVSKANRQNQLVEQVDNQSDLKQTNRSDSKQKNKKIFNNVIGFGRPLNLTNTQNTDKQNTDKQNSNSANVLNQLGGEFNGLFGPSDIVKIDIIGPKGKENNISSNKQLSDIFKAILGIPIETLEEESETKLKLKEYDLTKEYVEVEKNIKTIDDLLELAKLYDKTKPELMEKYTIDLKKLSEMSEPLLELKNMIGMESVKKSVIRQILYFLQGIEEQQDMLHMIITGSPGIGKTSLGVILAKLYYSMGILDSKPSINPVTGKKEDFIFKIYKRSDLIGQYLGHTANKTQKAIDECIGGVMFLDEAYSLGHEDKSDVYTKECLDTLNQNLSENKKNFILIIAGYPDQLDKCFFAHNEGLKRRFAFRYDIEKYTSKQLTEMLSLKINMNKWNFDDSINIDEITKLIESNKKMFENFGGDIESWLLHIKIEHGVRIFGKHPKLRRFINIDDLNNGLEQFKLAKENKHTKEKEEIQKRIRETMYM